MPRHRSLAYFPYFFCPGVTRVCLLVCVCARVRACARVPPPPTIRAFSINMKHLSWKGRPEEEGTAWDCSSTCSPRFRARARTTARWHTRVCVERVLGVLCSEHACFNVCVAVPVYLCVCLYMFSFVSMLYLVSVNNCICTSLFLSLGRGG